MNKSIYQQNIISLSSINPELAFSLSQVTPSDKCRIEISRDSSPVPVISSASKEIQLHSLYNPLREGEKLYQSSKDDSGFVIIFGLGGGYHILPYLNDPDIHHILIIETDKSFVRKILENIDLTRIFSDRKTDFLIDPDLYDLKTSLSEKYNPSIYGNLSIVQQKNRVISENDFFENLFKNIKDVLNSVYDDFANSGVNKSYIENQIKDILFFGIFS